MPTNWTEKLLDSIALYWTLWGIWWIAMYLNQVRKWKPFKIWMFCINVFVAWWIWIVIKDFIPESMWDMQYSLVSMSGFLAFPILDYLEEKWLTLFLNRIIWVKKWDVK